MLCQWVRESFRLAVESIEKTVLKEPGFWELNGFEKPLGGQSEK